jgi:hypothetical protein
MTPSEVAYLVMVIGALSIFASVLAFVSWYARPRRGTSTRATRAQTASPSPASHAIAR